MPAAEVIAKTILPPGFHMSVFAAEPDVQQPISMATDPRGRLWVAENYTYAEMPVRFHPDMTDRILVFEDSDNDGHFDKRSVFWEAKQKIMSVEVGLGGVWVLAMPNLVFIPDADGDGVADGPAQIVLDGFEHEKGGHTIANGLRWGPDGWLYGRHGIQSTSKIGPPGSPDEARIHMNVGIWRYHPTRKGVEIVAQGTTNPWGMDWDAHGELFFINTVIGHLWHVIPGAHYRRMYGDDPSPHIYEIIEQTADHVHWATGESWTDVRKGVSDVTLAAGGGHAHTGLMFYQGGQWPAEWGNKLLTVNLHGRRFNVESIERRGSGFVAHHGKDSFLFADRWFRGLDIVPAPDGSVYVNDWSDAGECHDNDGIHRTSGRIYKLTYGTSPKKPLDLTSLSDLDLAEKQLSENDWEARQARRVLAHRSTQRPVDAAARKRLETLADHGTNEVHHLRALWALHVSGGVDWKLLQHALSASESERAWALRLMEDESHWDSERGKLFEKFTTSNLPRVASTDKSGLVRLTAASLLQKLPLSSRSEIAKGLLEHGEDAEDHNLPLMLWYGIEPLATNDNRFVRLIASAKIPRVQRLAARRLAEDIDAVPQKVDELLSAIARNPNVTARRAVLDGLAAGFGGRRKVTKPGSWDKIQKELGADADERLLARIRDLSALFGDGRALEEIRLVALDPKADLPSRRDALQALIDARSPGLREVSERLLPVRDLTTTAARGLGVFDDVAAADYIISQWPDMYGHERPAVLNVLLSRPAWVERLLDAVAARKIKREEIGVAQARQIRDMKSENLTRKLTEVWGALQEPDEGTRKAALEKWRQKLTPASLKRGNPAEGQKLFAVSCGACHKLYGQGASIGPDLTGAGRQNLEYLLENILFPSAIVAAEFRQTTLDLKDGRSLSGIIKSRTPQAINLVMIGETITVSREDLEKEQTSALSLMPEGLLEPLTEGQVRDLFSYLMSTAPPNLPEPSRTR